MSLDEGDFLNIETQDEAPPPEEKSNRTFLIVMGIGALVIFLTLACIAIYAIFLSPSAKSRRQAEQATIEAQNAQLALQETSTAEAAAWTSTPQPSATFTSTRRPQLNTPTNTWTPVVALNSPTVMDPAVQATMLAAQTQLAAAMTGTMSAELAMGTRAIGGGATGMPTTGFFDEVGLPAMILLAGTLVIVIFLARRLRRAPH